MDTSSKNLQYLETKLNRMIETMERFDTRLQQFEAKINGSSSSSSNNNRLENSNRATYTPPQTSDDRTVIVKGFDSSFPVYYIKNMLSQYFSSCGEITSVTVPTDYYTGAAIGCAYIQLKEGVEKALRFNGSYLGEWCLKVEKATPIPISDVGIGFGPSGGDGRWPFPYRCNGLDYCSRC